MASSNRKRVWLGTRTYHAGRFALTALLSIASMGCPSRTLTITQDDYINTGSHVRRDADKRTGQPLEVTIVCVYPQDLEKAANNGLRLGLTCKDWYDHAPKPDGTGFQLPGDQIYVLTNRPGGGIGRRLGPSLAGAIQDGRADRSVGGIKFGKDLFDKRSAIYVFPKFIGPDRKVLPVPGAVFSPPGSYSSRISVKIGVDKSRYEQAPLYGQYIRNTSVRDKR